MPSINFDEREDRLVAEAMKDFFVSSSLSDGLRRPKGSLFMGESPRTGSDMADGSSVGCSCSRVDFGLIAVFDFISSPGTAATLRLLPLRIGSGLLVNSVLLPVPRMATGASLSRKKSSISVLDVLVMLLFRLEGVRFKLSVVVPALGDRPILPPLIVLPLRPRTAYLP